MHGMQIVQFCLTGDERNSEKFSLMCVFMLNHIQFNLYFLACVRSTSKQTCKGDKQHRTNKNKKNKKNNKKRKD